MKTNLRVFFGSAILSITLVVPSLLADVGSNNPTGTSGQFNGNVTTGGSYDPYTANATRSITDIVVPGAVGTYPLAFTRTMNSRYTPLPAGEGNAPAFGQPGTWRHNYQWSIDEAIVYNTWNQYALPFSYTVNYPDGRRVIFWGGRNGDPDFEGPPGVRDRMQGISGNNCYLRLPDGGKIWFRAWSDVEGQDGGPYTIYWTFTFMGIIDPYGQTTTVTYPNDYSMTITEPAGRMLKIFYGTLPYGGTAVSRVEARMTSTSSAVRIVYYHYSTYSTGGSTNTNYSALTSVAYPDGTAAAYSYQNDNIQSNGRPLIRTCVDPMYGGPMWKMAYAFQPNGTGVAYGQLQSEKYFDGTTIGVPVSSLYITGSSTRQETRGDGPHRTFNYSSYRLSSATDFNGHSAPQGYDSAGFVNSVTDRNGNATTYTNNAWTGRITTITYPLTASDRAHGWGQATTETVYGSEDGNNPYYIYTYTNGHAKVRGKGRGKGAAAKRRASNNGKLGARGYAGVNKSGRRDKRGITGTYLRDSTERVSTINYLDGGTETFTYNNFGQVLMHRLKVGGLETYAYDSRGLLREYRDAYHLSTADPQNPNVPTSSTPSLAYTYYASGPNMDRVYTITDARTNVTTFTYNNRGQVLTTTPPGVAYPVTNVYNTNGNGTLASITNELGKTVSYTYDDYKRRTSVTLPPPTTGPSPAPTTYSYDNTGGTNTDYTHTDANPTRVTLPSGKITKTVYDNDLLKSSVTVGYGTSDAATTTFTYDNNGNLKTVKDPNGQSSGLVSQYFYDEQNRVTDVDDPMVNDQTQHRNSNGHTVSWTYDQANNKLTDLRTNNQLITNVYDSMNHVTQTTAPQTPSPTAVTKYTYYAAGRSSGLLNTMQDPHLVGGNYSYTYAYDLMGRKTSVTYPPDSLNVSRTEVWTYDDAGNIHTFKNRANSTQTFSYDARNRMYGFTWSDGTSSETIVYDDASRVKEIDNADAVIKNTYFDDNTLQSQEEWAMADSAHHRTVSYTYDADLNRSTMGYPNSNTFLYGYTGRNQTYAIRPTNSGICAIVYGYDPNGNMSTSYEGGAVWTYGISYNAMNRCTHISRNFADVGTEGPRTFDYAYDRMNDRTSIQQDGGTPKTYAYDLAEQSTTETGSTTFTYDANGNRTGGTSYGTNNLNQYTTFNGGSVGYDNSNGNLKTYNTWTYIYDAQNRMKSAVKTGVNETFKYDGLNRQISHTLNGVTTYNVWDGWNLIEEYTTNLTVPANVYVYGGRGEIVERISGSTRILYFQDALGNTSHISDASGNLLESYTYSRTGTPSFYYYDANGNPHLRNPNQSGYGVRHLFHGQLWTQETGLNDYRNRIQLPAMGIFMQTDPIRFGGDPTNLYRFCGNNAFNRHDPLGLDILQKQAEDRGAPTGDDVLDQGDYSDYNGGNSDSTNSDNSDTANSDSSSDQEPTADNPDSVDNTSGPADNPAASDRTTNPDDLTNPFTGEKIPYTSGLGRDAAIGAIGGATVDGTVGVVGGTIVGNEIGGPLGGAVFGLAGLFGGVLEGGVTGAAIGTASGVIYNIITGNY